MKKEIEYIDRVIRNNALTPNAKLLYIELVYLSDDDGITNVSNTYLSDVFDMQVRNIQALLSDLRLAGIISCDYNSDTKERKIIVNTEYLPSTVKVATLSDYKFECLPSKTHPVCEWVLTKEDYDWYKSTYPDTDIDLELKKMWRWLKENELKSYDAMGRFVSGWLARVSKSDKSQKLKDKAREIFIKKNENAFEQIERANKEYEVFEKNMTPEMREMLDLIGGKKNDNNRNKQLNSTD